MPQVFVECGWNPLLHCRQRVLNPCRLKYNGSNGSLSVDQLLFRVETLTQSTMQGNLVPWLSKRTWFSRGISLAGTGRIGSLARKLFVWVHRMSSGIGFKIGYRTLTSGSGSDVGHSKSANRSTSSISRSHPHRKRANRLVQQISEPTRPLTCS